jgi:hypothetical protein
MLEYSGSVAGRKLRDAIRLGVGRCVTASHWMNPIAGQPWFLDNGAFTCFRQGIPYTAVEDQFRACLRKIPAEHPPDFIVAPDIVGGGFASLRFSLRWLDELPPQHDYYFAVQDGLAHKDVRPHLEHVTGLFIGGSVDWKWTTAGEWIALAHDHGIKAHIGRVGTVAHQVLARQLGADSIDSSSWSQNDSHHHVAAARSQQVLGAIDVRRTMKVLCYNILWLHDVHVCRLPISHAEPCRWSLLYPLAWDDDETAWDGLPQNLMRAVSDFARATPEMLEAFLAGSAAAGAKPKPGPAPVHPRGRPPP